MSQNRIIAKNSLLLYVRLIITTIIGLYTSRIVLLELGAANFGLYAVVGGIVAMMNLLNTTMISTSNRFLSVEMGRGEECRLNRIFNTLQIIHILFAVLLLLAVEIIGVWYVNNFLKFESANIGDALFVLHLSALSAAFSAIIIPHQGLITANEKFNFRVFVEVLTSLLTLGVIAIFMLNTGNKLRAYAVYVFIVQLVICMLYYLYTWKHYSAIVRWNFNQHIEDYKEISRFFGWQSIYVLGSVGSIQGGNVIMNFFFGTVLNAAFSIANRINEFVYSFVKSMNQAAIPQIMKSVGAGNSERSLELIYKLSKWTFFIMLIPAVPIMISIDTILQIWLKEVPPYTSIFVLFRITNGLVGCTASGFDAIIDATGNIKKIKIIYAIITLCSLPTTYFLFFFGLPPYSVTIVFISIEIILIIIYALFISKISEFSIKRYLSESITPIILVSLSVLPQFYFCGFLQRQNLLSLVIISLISIFWNLFAIYLIGLSDEERNIARRVSDKIRIFASHPSGKNY